MNFHHYRVYLLEKKRDSSLNKAQGRFVSGLAEISSLDSTRKLNDNDNIWITTMTTKIGSETLVRGSWSRGANNY